MWREYFLFEANYRFRQPLFWMTALALFISGLALISTDAGVMMTVENTSVLRNAPIVIIQCQSILSNLALFVLTAFVADSVIRDFRLNTHMFFFTKPASKGHYLAGRFLGSFSASTLLFLAPIAGFIVASYMPWQDPQRLGPFSLGAVLYGFFALVIPNLMVLSSLFFATAVLSRRLLVVYLIPVGVLMLQEVFEGFARVIDHKILASVLEPMGFVALDEITSYYTVAQLNLMVPEISLGLILNRLAWLLLAALALWVGYSKFKTTAPNTSSKKPKSARVGQPTPTAAYPSVKTSFSPTSNLLRLSHRVRLETAIVFKSVPFLVLLLTAALFTFLITTVAGSYRSIPALPNTGLMLEVVGRVVTLFVPIFIIIYSGELVWRQPRTATIEDVMPVLNWVFATSKALTLFTVIAVTLFASVATTLCNQLFQGYTNFELPLYAKGMMVLAYPMLLLAVLAVFLHALAKSKYQGHLLVLLLLIIGFAATRLGMSHSLFHYGKLPPMVYSVFNGYGHFAKPFMLYGFYQTLVALIFFALTLLLWRRGVNPSLKGRLVLAKTRFQGPSRLLLPAFMAALVASGWMIHLGSENDLTQRDLHEKHARYERNYAQYQDNPLPRVTGVELTVDLFPAQRQAAIKGSYKLINDGDQPITMLPVTLSPRFVEDFSRVEGGVRLVSFGNLTARIADEAAGFYLFPLEQPLMPNQQMRLRFEVAVDQSSYRNRLVNYQIVANGSFMIGRNFLPHLGYNSENELIEPTIRRKHGLGPARAYPQAVDTQVHSQNYLNSDWIDFEAVFSTAADQVVVAQGELIREWQGDGRRYFHYKTQAPIVNLVLFFSGNFEVRRERFNDIEIEIYHHPDHHYNIDRLMAVTKATLDYAGKAFGPYPHHQLRIVEVPKYDSGLAISLGGLFAMAEDTGFTGRGGDLDVMSYFASHEVAHQWWNGQVISARAQGACMIGESLAQYTSLAVLEQLYGKPAVHEFLLDDTQVYFQGRQKELLKELPLVQVENQSYIHYEKANVAFAALRDVMGEQALNEALQGFFTDYRFAGPPYPIAEELITRLKDVATPEVEQLIEDLFETVTVYDNRILNASYKAAEEGRFLVEIDLISHKLRLDEQGLEREVPGTGSLQIGCYVADQLLPFNISTHQITGAQMQVNFYVDQLPSRVGVDPYLHMLDNQRKDNFKTVQAAGRSIDVAN